MTEHAPRAANAANASAGHAVPGGGSVLALFRRPDAAITPNPAAIAAEARAAEALPDEAGLSLMAP
jgi:hypothetical protein